MPLSPVGLQGDDSGLERLRLRFSILVIHDLHTVQPGFDVCAFRVNVEVIPIELLANGVFLVAFAQPMVRVKAHVFFRGTTTNVDLITRAAALPWLLAQVNAAVVLPVLIDHEIEFDFEILKLVLGGEQTVAFGIALLSAVNHTVSDVPTGAAQLCPIGEIRSIEQRTPWSLLVVRGENRPSRARHDGTEKTN